MSVDSIKIVETNKKSLDTIIKGHKINFNIEKTESICYLYVIGILTILI